MGMQSKCQVLPPLHAGRVRGCLHARVSTTAANSYDVAIIGGGINGTGTARDLSKRGLRVYLAERHDFGFGASGNSSGMFHGGARYLLSDPSVTRDACRDSGYVQDIAKNLIFRIPFLIPVYSTRRFARSYAFLMDVFFSSYDRYQPLKKGLPHSRLDAEDTLGIEPGLRSEGLLGAITTDEWGIDTYRLCALNALDARAHGATIENHTSVTELVRGPDGRTSGVIARGADGRARRIDAKLVLNCTGAWNALSRPGLPLEVGVRPGKGVHLVFDARISDYALVTFAVDGRQVFLMPHQNECWMGTTDDDFYGDPDRLEVTRDEVEYLLSAAEHAFPSIRGYRCFATAAGLRPTVHAWGPNEDDLSREHRIIDHAAHGIPGCLSMIGGKLASYRSMSEELADRALQALERPHVPSRTHLDPLPGHERLVDAAELARRYRIDGVAARRIVRRHGTLAESLLHRGTQVPGGLATACACEPVLECEVRHVLEHEWIGAPEDLARRCRVAAGPCLGFRCARRVGELYAEHKGGGSAVARDAARALTERAVRRALPVLEGAPAGALRAQVERVEQAYLDNGGCADG